MFNHYAFMNRDSWEDIFQVLFGSRMSTCRAGMRRGARLCVGPPLCSVLRPPVLSPHLTPAEPLTSHSHRSVTVGAVYSHWG